MDDEDFEDILAEFDMRKASSHEPLTYGAAHLDFCNKKAQTPMIVQRSLPASITTLENGECQVVGSAKTVDVIPCSSSFHNFASSTETKSSPTLPQSEPTSTCSHDVLSQRNPSVETRNATVIEQIEAVFEGIADALLNGEDSFTIKLKVRMRSTDRNAMPKSGRKIHDAATKERHICFPGKSAQEACRFTIVTRVLELVHEALRNGTVLSKRDLYYRDPALFGSQTRVDRCIDDIALTFGVPRSALNITAIAKGLVAGAVSFCRRDGSIVNTANDRGGILVPPLRDILSVDMTTVKWIVVIEKEATFRSIAASSFWERVSTEGIIMTGKGYPDIASRALLRFMSIPSPRNGFASPKVYGLADFDPDGLAIFSTYKRGSLALAHENDDLVVPQIQWLGLRNEHMILGNDHTHASQGLLELTVRDRKKAMEVLMREYGSGDAGVEIARALQTMLVLNIKAELQLLDAVPNGMVDLLTSALGKYED